jgi:hypothetical protein
VISKLLTEGVVDADSPCHALLTLNRREDFGRVLECDRSFSERVHNCEEVDEPMRIVSTVKIALDEDYNSQHDWSKTRAGTCVLRGQK